MSAQDDAVRELIKLMQGTGRIRESARGVEFLDDRGVWQEVRNANEQVVEQVVRTRRVRPQEERKAVWAIGIIQALKEENVFLQKVWCITSYSPTLAVEVETITLPENPYIFSGDKPTNSELSYIFVSVNPAGKVYLDRITTRYSTNLISTPYGNSRRRRFITARKSFQIKGTSVIELKSSLSHRADGINKDYIEVQNATVLLYNENGRIDFQLPFPDRNFMYSQNFNNLASRKTFYTLPIFNTDLPSFTLIPQPSTERFTAFSKTKYSWSREPVDDNDVISIGNSIFEFKTKEYKTQRIKRPKNLLPLPGEAAPVFRVYGQGTSYPGTSDPYPLFENIPQGQQLLRFGEYLILSTAIYF